MRTTVLAWVLFASIAGPAFPAAKPVPRHKAQSGTRSDSEIETDIRARFARSKVASDGFQVSVKDGVATIRGRTEVLQRKGAATRMARSAGAVRVVNRVEISEVARRKAVANLSKAKPREPGGTQ